VDLGLRDSVCLVTGSTGGIGAAVAELLRAEGAVVARPVVTTGAPSTASRRATSRPMPPVEPVTTQTVS
jgi:NAD(P)-dependent dehydrogenase (short-subunit alcohol dehydrogenase family)